MYNQYYDFQNRMNPYGQYQYNQYQPYQYIQNTQALSGKFVDSVDIVRATEVPMGGNGIFPKADLSEIYIKSWNNDGTTRIVTFKPIIDTTSESEPMGDILKQLEDLTAKIDRLSTELGADV